MNLESEFIIHGKYKIISVIKVYSPDLAVKNRDFPFDDFKLLFERDE